MSVATGTPVRRVNESLLPDVHIRSRCPEQKHQTREPVMLRWTDQDPGRPVSRG
jgi:hypothetical protein